MISQDQVQQVIGTTAYDSNGDKLGKVGQVYFDDATGEPEWATVNTGLFGTSESFVPIRDAEFSGDRLVVHHDKDRVKDAPNVGADGHLSPDEERTTICASSASITVGRSDAGSPCARDPPIVPKWRT